MTFIIPQENRRQQVGGLIARWNVDNAALEITGKIDIPYESKSVMTDNGLIVAIYFGKKPKHFRLKL